MQTSTPIAHSTLAVLDSRLRRSALWVLALTLMLGPALSIAEDSEPLPPGDDFGAGITLAQPTALADVVAHPERYAEEPVLVRGRLTDVCQRKGCWTVITDDTVAVRIRFHDYGFFLPKDSVGREAIAEGLVKAETLDEKTARHYESESKDGDPNSIEGPQQVVGFTATGMRLLASQ